MPETYFDSFRRNIIGIDQTFSSPYGEMKIVYADWIASGRLYQPIEQKLCEIFGPFVGNTHTEATETGTLMTKAYQLSHQMIKKHVNAGADDVIITYGFGMTAVINKLQRILGFKVPDKFDQCRCLAENDRPVVFISHMEHHSNQTSWFETIADVVVVPPGKDLLIDLDYLRESVKEFSGRKMKIGSFTACSNVTGISTPYHEMAKIMHEYGGLCFVDFAASAPYDKIDMHPGEPGTDLDAIFFSPHKFLGGPGSSGVLIFNSKLYSNPIPDNPGGGTVDWTNPWGEFKYIDDIEVREDGGTPGFLQSIKTALAIELKNLMGIEKIHHREQELVRMAFKEFRKIPGIHILADNVENRLGIFSFYLEHIHFNLVVKLLNDRWGIQTRGGCACAGTYGHFLLDVSYEKSHEITDLINSGDLSRKPGWIRVSLHPTMTDDELYLIVYALKEISENAEQWKDDYIYNIHNNEFRHKIEPEDKTFMVKDWFRL